MAEGRCKQDELVLAAEMLLKLAGDILVKKLDPEQVRVELDLVTDEHEQVRPRRLVVEVVERE